MAFSNPFVFRLFLAAFLALALFTAPAARAFGLFSSGDFCKLPDGVEAAYSKGLHFLAATQRADGAWGDGYGREPGVVGLCVVAMLAHGDDPNYGTYAVNIKRGINYILSNANKGNGYIGRSMYNHGFATLALAESYGMVDDDRIGPILEKAVALLLTSQAKNPHNAWRYSPTSRDADTTVSGACFVALIAAANAGIEVPDKAIKESLKYYASCQSEDGGIGYVGPGGSNLPRTAIGALVYSLARKTNATTYKRMFSYLNSNTPGPNNTFGYFHYYLYYAAQAYFRSPKKDVWNRWNLANIKLLQTSQQGNGAWRGSYGTTFATAASLLSLALNYRYLPIYER